MFAEGREEDRAYRESRPRGTWTDWWWEPGPDELRPAHPWSIEQARAGRASHHATADECLLSVVWLLNQAETPAELEMYYQGLRPLLVGVPVYEQELHRIYLEMWNHFTRGAGG